MSTFRRLAFYRCAIDVLVCCVACVDSLDGRFSLVQFVHIRCATFFALLFFLALVSLHAAARCAHSVAERVS